ncbi:MULTISPECIES: DUF4258 domain-containing protein [Methylomonas]|uniref:DUF4258 domain-containing protein n=2 Tax=Methylomonas TaxID=416 RepID=A0A140E3C7_9GAMM|nr:MULTISPECIES: DUF4258 domain-containing protein [Methylomonas]AMK74901.1 hypothetical protein JT25_000110 [Methylomonas denitrificans]TCV81028.1 uncharacterized protein DUF4258 [Methylomonas methanica]
MKLIYRKHAIIRMFERGIRDEDIRWVLSSGEIISDYPNDSPYPSRLILGWVDKNPIHVLTAQAEDDQMIVITAYRPDSKLWESDFKRKRP